ncbi:MAG: pyridoxamine 5'-phosphate oxidase [Sphingopyxis sp.]
MADNPHALFDTWFAEAKQSEPNDAEAMALATVDSDGRPSVRMVLLKGHDTNGFVFYTNQQSRKGEALSAHPHAALLFHWKSLRRQIRIEGDVATVSDAEADAYFATRSRDSRIGAIASDQSRPLNSRAHFLTRVAEVAARNAIGTIARPPHWSGYRVIPHHFEFWRDMPFRLHERRVFDADGQGGWNEGLLYP